MTAPAIAEGAETAATPPARTDAKYVAPNSRLEQMQVERSKPGKSVYAQIGVWLDENTGHIHLTIPNSGWFHTTVNATDGSIRCHKNLYAKLGRLLRENDAPAPDPDLTPDYPKE